MSCRLLFPALLATSVAGMAHAAEPAPGATLGTTAEEIETALAADGYEMTRYDKRPALILVQAVRDGTRHMLFLNGRSGEIVKAQQAGRRSPSLRPAGTTTGETIATPQQAAGGPTPATVAGDDAIRARLAAEGYQITRFERESGRIEVYATKDGQLWELKLDPRTGQTLTAEAED